MILALDAHYALLDGGGTVLCQFGATTPDQTNLSSAVDAEQAALLT